MNFIDSTDFTNIDNTTYSAPDWTTWTGEEALQVLPGKPPWYTPDMWIVIFKVYFGITSIFGTIGNIITIVAVITTKELQTIPNYYVTSLAFADLGVCFILMPISIVTYTYAIPHWLCQIIGYFNLLSTFVSIIHLGLIAVNRYILICQSKDVYNRIYSTRNVCISIVGSWIFVFLIYSLPFFGFGSYGYNPFHGVCIMTGIFVIF